MIIIPFASFEDFSDCLSKISPKENPRTGKPYGKEVASKICGRLQAKHEKKKKSYQLPMPAEFKDTYFEAIMSSPKLDLGNDIVTEECIMDMIRQVQANASTLKGSLYHDAILEKNPNLLPISRLESAEMLPDGKIKFVGKFNENHPEFSTLLPQFKDKFIDGISIEYIPEEGPEGFRNMEKNGKIIRLLNKIKLLGYGHVPRPMNPDASIIEVFAKSIEESKESEIDEMVSLIEKEGVLMETKQEPSEPSEEKPSESKASEGQPESKMSMESCMAAKTKDGMSESDAKNACEKMMSEKTEKSASTENVEVKDLKSQLEQAQKELAELKARVDDKKYLEEVKSIVETKIKELNPQSKVLIPSETEVAESVKNLTFSDILRARYGG